jgi:uncharacterized RDD family membrane protein YckC
VTDQPTSLYQPRPGYPPPGGFLPLPPPPVGPDGSPLAEFSQRMVAYIIDAVTIGLVSAVPMVAVGAAAILPRVSRFRPGEPGFIRTVILFEVAWVAVAVVFQALVSYLYVVTYGWRSGQTVGKRVMRIKVVRAGDGSPLDRRTARRRWLVKYPSQTFAPYFGYADGLWQAWDKPYRQCLHDKAAETVVVKVSRG